MAENSFPQEIEIQYEKASMAVDKKNFNYAIELLTHVINIKSDFAKGRQLLRLAEIKNFEENPPNIVMQFIYKILSFPHRFIATISEMKGDNYRAISICEKILRKDPKNVAVLVKLGNLLRVGGMKKSSVVTLEFAVKISEKNPIAYQLLGEAYSAIGNYDHASFCFKKVLELKPHNANAERGLKNIAALTTIDKSFGKKDNSDFKIREITE